VTQGSPADKAGLKEGDVLRTFNGQRVENIGSFRSLVAGPSPGIEITLGILRNGESLTIKVKLEEQPANMASLGGGPTEGTLRGIQVQNLTPSIRDQLGLPSSAHGVVISELDPDSPAAQTGLQPGDVIQSIERQPVNSVADFNRLAAPAKGKVLLRVNRQGYSQWVVISPDGD
jgi:serine protease Do